MWQRHFRSSVILTLGLCVSFCNSPARDNNRDCTGSDCAAVCAKDTDCTCHEICVKGACLPLAGPDHSSNGHGNWQSLGDNRGQQFLGVCESDDQCSLGEICNPLTRGCISAASYLIACDSSNNCPAGQSGEILTCDAQSRLCLPAPACRSEANCCGNTTLSCDANAGVCLARHDECQPPPQVTDQCPFAPRSDIGCENRPDTFCSNLGRCVECVCDADCDPQTGMSRCYATSGRCVTQDYCENTSDCSIAGNNCDVVRRLCVPACTLDEQCPNGAYCESTLQVCRAWTDRACVNDSFEPNNSADQALSAASTLPLPNLNNSVTISDLSFCDSDSDWYIVDAQRADRLIIGGTSFNVRATLSLLERDANTVLARGSIDPNQRDPIDVTINNAGTYYLRIDRQSTTAGFYRLDVQKLAGSACDDVLENTDNRSNSNNTPIDATWLYDNLASNESPCTLSTSAAADTVTCGGDLLQLCDGDVDYYRVRLPAGATFRAAITGFVGNLDMAIFADASLSPLATSATNLPSESVQIVARRAGEYLVQIQRNNGRSTAYDLNLRIDKPAFACSEDDYDIGGNNDSSDQIPWLAVSSSDAHDSSPVVTQALTLCRGDADYFRLGIVTPSGFTDLPAGMRVQLNLLGDSAGLRISSGSNAQMLHSNATDFISTGAPVYLSITGDTAVDRRPPVYQLRVTLTQAPACSVDNLGDTEFDNNNTLNRATLLVNAPWPQNIGEAHTQAELSLCATDADWYALDPPPGAATIVTVQSAPTADAISVSLYNQNGLSGLLDESHSAGHDYQRVYGLNAAYVKIDNKSGWPIQNYSLDVHYISAACSADAFEPNDLATQARTIGEGLTDALTVCDTATHDDGPDWYKVMLSSGDALRVRAYYQASQGDLDLALYAPLQNGDPGERLALATDDAGTLNYLEVNYIASMNAHRGEYLLKVVPTLSNANLYYFDTQIIRSCTDDASEPASPALYTALNASDAALGLELQLCNDEDWYAITTSTPLTVCTNFEHIDGDIDLEVYDSIAATHRLAASLSKNDYERVVLSGAPSNQYFVRVFLDPRDAVNTAYTLTVLNGDVACPN